MFLSRSKFDVFTDTQTPFTGRKNGVLCVGVCSIAVEQDCSVNLWGVLLAVANINTDLDMGQKTQRGRLFVHEKRIWTTENIRRYGRACSYKNLAKPKEIVTKNKSGNQDSTNNSLAMWREWYMYPLLLHTKSNYSRESLPPCGLLPKTCCSVFGRCWSTELTCIMSQVERILNIFEIFY